jgi:acyl carrier protein
VHRQAKKDTVDKVCGIVKKQLALAEDAQVSGASKFSELGADSLDTVLLPSCFYCF